MKRQNEFAVREYSVTILKLCIGLKRNYLKFYQTSPMRPHQAIYAKHLVNIGTKREHT